MDLFNPYAFQRWGFTFGGWPNGTAVATVDKFNFSIESSTTLGTGLSTARLVNTGFASPNAGYTAGGVSATSGGTYLSSVEKFIFTTNSRSTLSATLTTGLSSVVGFGFSYAGYVAGGTTSSSRVTTVDKFALPADSRSTLGTGLSSSRSGMAGFSSLVSGYVAGGITNTPSVTNTVEKFTFSTDARSSVSTGLGTSRSYGAGINSYSSGYVVCGANATNGTGTPTATYNAIDKYVFSTDTRSALTATYSVNQPMPLSSRDYGYAVGGDSGSSVATAVKINFSNDTISTLNTALPSARDGGAGASPPLA